MSKDKAVKTIPVGEHWRHQLTQLRCFFTGFKEARGGQNSVNIPGEDVLRQIIIAIDDAKT